MIVFTGADLGCAATDESNAVAVQQPESVSAVASPFVGTWRWSGSGHRAGEIELGEESFVFRNDGTYAVLSKAGDGSSECYEGKFTWSTAREPGRGKIRFVSSHVQNVGNTFESDVTYDGGDTLHFDDGGTYRRTGTVRDVRCP